METTSIGNKWIRTGAKGVFLVVLTFLVAPVLSIFTSGYLGSAEYVNWQSIMTALGVSLGCNTVAMLIIVVLGLPCAHFMLSTQTRFKSCLEILLYIPTVMPPAVMGLLLLITFGSQGTIGKWLGCMGIQLTFSSRGVVLVLVFLGLPIFVRGVVESIKMIEKELILSARVEGCNELQLFVKIIYPLARSGMLNAFLLTLARLLAEFGATIMFAGNIEGRTQTMPLAIYTAMETNMSEALVMASMMLGIAFVMMAVVSWIGK